MGVTLSTINLIDLQTSFMKQDITTQGLCSTLNPKFQELSDEVRQALIFSRVGELDDVALDELAWQMHVDFYDATAEIEIKRQLVKNALIIHKTKGTPFAVEKLIQTIFGDGYVQEWFEYGGEPYMFKVITNNPSVTGEDASKFIKILDSVKNIRSHLEEIMIALSGEMNLYIACVVHTGDNLEIRQVV